MIKYHLEVAKDYKRQKDNKAFKLTNLLHQYNDHLYDEAHLRTFDVQIEDVGDLENHTIFVSEYRKEPYEIHVADRFMGSADCSCFSYFFDAASNCMHIEAIKRLYNENMDFRARFSRRRRESTYLGYDSFNQEPTLLGNWPKPLLAEAGLSDQDTNKIDFEKFAEWHKANPKLVSKQITTNYLNRITKKALAKANEDWAAALNPQQFLKKQLYSFQELGIKHLAGKRRAVLADAMGLGKTIQTIGAVESLYDAGRVKRALVICPSSVKHNWMMEVRACTSHNATILHNLKSINQFILNGDDSLFVIASYELVQRNIESIQTQKFDVVIIDEAQRVRNFETKTWAAIRSIKSDYLFVLSGTLIENKLNDLFAIMELIDPDVLGPRWKFESTYFKTVGDRFGGYHQLKNLRERVGPYILRRNKEEVLKDLPPMTEVTIYCPMNTEQAHLEGNYRETAQRLLAMSSTRELSFAEKQILNNCLLKARQACNAVELCKPDHPKPGSPKLEEFQRVVEDICRDSNQKVLVFSEWIEMLKLAAKKLEHLGLEYTMFNGTIAVQKRPKLIEEFLQSPNKRVFLSTDAGGVGLNLQEASNVIHLDIPWNPARLDQRNGRVHRINQKNNCYITYFVSENGIERGIEAVLKSKRGIRSASLNEDSDVDEVSFESFSSALSKVLENDD